MTITREEAILILEEEAEFLYQDDRPYNREAFDMAIEALKTEPIRCGECENYIDRRCIEVNHHVAAHENCTKVFGAKRREL